MRTIHTEIKPNTPEWLDLRATKFNASEAATMMGVSPYMTRTELMALKKAGVSAPVTKQMQYLFDRGHAAEAAARPIVSAMACEVLKPAVMTHGKLLASLDGRSESGELIWEHKLWNASLAAAVQDGELSPAYYWQLEQQLLVSGADEVLFVVSDGTKDNLVSMFYTAVPGRAEQLTAGWAQFEEDLKAYVHVEAAPVAVGKAPDELPALRIELTGMVTGSNLQAFEASALAVIGSVKTTLTTDQDFADAKKAVKWCGDVEKAVALAKQQALSQTASIDELFRSLDRISKNARDTRLELDKLVKTQDLSIKVEIKQTGETALAEHIATINKRLGSVQLPPIAADFAGAMKGKSKLDNMRDAVDTELARAKIDANAVAEGIESNLKTLRELAPDHVFLFRDAQQIITKAADDFALLVKSRIAEHETAEQARLEQERERIRAEELAKIERQRLREEAEARQKAMQAEAVEREQAVAAVQPSNVVEMPAEPVKQSARRPSDDEIIEVLAQHYRVHESKVIEWIITMDMESASTRMVGAI